MWVLENDGDVFQGKRLWLRPGKKFLFGRTTSEDGQFALFDKTVSRQHLTVEVEAVDASSCGNIRSKSRVTVADLNTKIGTLLNGEQIRGKGIELVNEENTIALGRFKNHFRIKWVPVTLSFSFTTKELNSNPYPALYEILGPLDIKVLPNYERGFTTHLVAKKRNTPKGLQALIDGKYIVYYDSFIQAIVAAATTSTSSTESGVPSRSLLEEDFDANFPFPLHHLPPKAAEPTQREPSEYAPNEKRRDMFDGYTFVFYEKRQFDTLLAPISDGHGKALFNEVMPNQITVDEFVRYVKNVAGDKGLGEFEDGSEGKGVVVVRFNPVKGAGSEWFADFGRQVALRLDHRLIEQNEFLDAILGCDASVLRRPLEIEPSGIESVAPPPLAITWKPHETISAPQPKEVVSFTASATNTQAHPGRARCRKPVVSRFRGFDDDDDDQVDEKQLFESAVAGPSAAVTSQSQGLFVSQVDSVDHEDALHSRDPQARHIRKRPASVLDESDHEEDILEQVAPAAAALKKRRLADGTSLPKALPALSHKVEASPKSSTKPVKQEMDVFEITRRQRQEAAAAAAEKEADSAAQIDGVNINEIRNLTIVEEIEVKRSFPPPRPHGRADDSERWDDKWNGRKDFKKFRRRGATPTSRDIHRVIVPLEEVKKRDFGIGDEYWLEESSQRKKRKEKTKESRATDETQTESRYQAQPADRHVKETMQAVTIERGPGYKSSVRGTADEELDKTRHQHQPSSSQTVPLEVPPNHATHGKTAATISTMAQPPKKKLRPTVMRREEKEDSDDSEDELRFKFRKRK